MNKQKILNNLTDIIFVFVFIAITVNFIQIKQIKKDNKDHIESLQSLHSQILDNERLIATLTDDQVKTSSYIASHSDSFLTLTKDILPSYKSILNTLSETDLHLLNRININFDILNQYQQLYPLEPDQNGIFNILPIEHIKPKESAE